MDKITHLYMDHIHDIMHIVKEAVKHMDANGIPQWDEIYPDQAIFENDISQNTIFGYFLENTLAGVMVLNWFQADEYKTIDWKLDDDLPLVIHRLCIAPSFQSRGMAKSMVRFAEDFARENNFKSIRLDAFKQNPVSLSLYRKLGYEERGTVTFRKGDFFVFEKEL